MVIWKSPPLHTSENRRGSRPYIRRKGEYLEEAWTQQLFEKTISFNLSSHLSCCPSRVLPMDLFTVWLVLSSSPLVCKNSKVQERGIENWKSVINMYKLIVTLLRSLSIFLLFQLYFFITQLCWILDSDWSIRAFYGLLFLYSRPLLWITDFCYGRRSDHIPVGVLHHPVGVNFSIMTVSLYIIPYIIYTIPEDGMLMWFGAWHQTPQTGTCLPELRNSTVIRFLVCQC